MAKQQAVNDIEAPVYERQASDTQEGSGSPPAYSPPLNQAGESQPLLGARDQASYGTQKRPWREAVGHWWNNAWPKLKRKPAVSASNRCSKSCSVRLLTFLSAFYLVTIRVYHRRISPPHICGSYCSFHCICGTTSLALAFSSRSCFVRSSNRMPH